MILILIRFCEAFVLICIVLYLRVLYKCVRKAKVNICSGNNKTTFLLSQAPGPLPLPVIGNLNLLRKYPAPFEAFTDLTKRYGNIYSLTLGTTRCVVVSNLDLIREVLNENGKFFGGRPNFLRYHKLFGGNRNNSLALCDWSTLQQKRRNLARKYCSPRDSSLFFTKMSNVGCFEASEMMELLRRHIIPGKPLELKPLIQLTCANMFMQYMCSIRFDYEDLQFQQTVAYFDEIFWEINQGYAVDFLPWLAPFYKKHFRTIVNWSTNIRTFILERIIHNKEQNLDPNKFEKDFTDVLLESLIKEKNISRTTIIYMLEDFIGGHSAVGNLVMLVLIYIAKYPHVGKKIQAEVDMVSDFGKRKLTLYDKEAMPYTMATIYEVLRFSSSPIVPHVATENVIISGYGVLAGTVVFINNYNLNKSNEYWTDAYQFNPERFLEKVPKTELKQSILKPVISKIKNSNSSDSGAEFDIDHRGVTSFRSSRTYNPLSNSIENNLENNIRIKKRLPHFLPFSIGKRTCIGQKLVQGFGFILLANILQSYEIHSENVSSLKLSPASVALPTKTFPLLLTERISQTNK